MSAAVDEILLAKTTTVAKYRALEIAKDRIGIANFVEARFTERYVKSLSMDQASKSGFAMMALACLMIEALEAFWRGRSKTEGRGADVFRSFFERNDQFAVLAPQAAEFYKNIRCGLLHQAETTGGWRIRRSGPLYDPKSRIVNATRFLSALQIALSQYASELRRAQWDAQIWRHFRKKMDSICASAVGE